MYQKGNKELIILSLYLGDYSRRFYLREISKLSRLPLKTTQRILENLTKSRILKSEIHGKNRYFFLNLDNIETKFLLLKSEIYKTIIFLKKYTFFKSFLKEIKNLSTTIIIFGSFARFTANNSPDIDILLVSKRKIKLPYYILPNKFHEIQISESNIVKSFKMKAALIKKIQENHVILNDHSFFVNLMWNQYEK